MKWYRVSCDCGWSSLSSYPGMRIAQRAAKNHEIKSGCIHEEHEITFSQMDDENDGCPYCNHFEKETCDQRSYGYTCTREKGHHGKHVACAALGNHVAFEWDNKESVN